MSGNVVQKNKTFASVVVDMAESGPKWPPPPATSVSPAAGTSSPTGGWTESQERDNVEWGDIGSEPARAHGRRRRWEFEEGAGLRAGQFMDYA